MENWTSALDDITKQFTVQFGNLTADQLNWKSEPKSWSVAQIVDHIIVVNESYYPILSSLQSGTYTLPFMARFGFMVTLFGNLILKASQPDRRNRSKTFPLWEPGRSAIPADILTRFENHQNELKKKIQESEELVDKGAVISSPANKNIVYRLEAAFDIIIAHERRHLEQAREVFRLITGAP
jgi:hypothetical protein